MKYLNDKGMSIVEILMGAAIVSIAGMGLTVAVQSMARAQIKTQVVADAVSLETLLARAIQEPTTYTSYKTLLQQGDDASFEQFKTQFRVAVPSWGSGQLAIGETYFSRSGEVCANFSVNNCLYRVNLQVQRTPGTPPTYAFAYRIQLNEDMVPMTPLGAKTSDAAGNTYLGNNFAVDDYRYKVPTSVTAANIVCASGQIAMGFDASTGLLNCAGVSTAPCPANTIPIGIQIVNNNVQLNCQPVRRITCSDGTANSVAYALSSFQLNTLDSRVPASTAVSGARCAFVAQSQVSALTGGEGQEQAASLPMSGGNGWDTSGTRFRYGITGPGGWGTFCPAGYNAVITQCAAVLANVSGMPSRCPTGFPRDCNSETNAAWPAGVWYGPPADGSYAGALVAPLNVGTVIAQTSGNRARCVINNGGQPAGAGWIGYVNMSVVCQVDTTVYPPNRTPAIL